MNKDIQAYNSKQSPLDREICEALMKLIDRHLSFTEAKIWHAHPVWFIKGNPIVGYSKLKDSVKLLFWSGVDFGEINLRPGSGKFKDASISYTSKDQLNEVDLKRWLAKAEKIQWDYKNIVKLKGQLKRLS